MKYTLWRFVEVYVKIDKNSIIEKFWDWKKKIQ